MTARTTAVVASMVLAGAAAAQVSVGADGYRQGTPDVLAAPRVQEAPGTVFDRSRFSAAYARAGRPTIAVLWNREFSDMLEQGSASQLSIDTTRTGVATSESVRLPGYAGARVTGAVVGNTTVTAGEARTQQAVRSGPAERTDLQMRSAFMQAMTGAGAKVVDRNVVMRTTARRSGGRDSQQVETDALAAHARLVIEVLNTRDSASPTGWSTYLSIKRMADGVVLAEGYMDGGAAAGPRPAPRFEADPRGGFREVAIAAPQPADMGRMAAEHALTRLADALVR